MSDNNLENFFNEIATKDVPQGCAIVILSDSAKPIWIVNKISSSAFLGGIERVKFDIMNEESKMEKGN